MLFAYPTCPVEEIHSICLPDQAESVAQRKKNKNRRNKRDMERETARSSSCFSSSSPHYPIPEANYFWIMIFYQVFDSLLYTIVTQL